MDISFSIPPKGTIIKQWPCHIDSIGRLSVAEFKELSFIPVRFFIVDKAPTGAERGGHAHKTTVQYLFCVKGIIQVLLNTGIEKREFILREGQGTLIDKMTWDVQRFMTGDDILLVLCSTEYNREDYITDFDQFKKLVNESK